MRHLTCVGWMKVEKSEQQIYDRIPRLVIPAYSTQPGKLWMLQDALQVSVHDHWLFKINGRLQKERPRAHLQMRRRQSRRYQTYNFSVLQMALNDNAKQRLQILSLDVFRNLDQRSLIE